MSSIEDKMTETCLDCVRKHLGAAEGLIWEALSGYPIHRWLAVGQLHLAESECRKLYPGLADMIRKCRLLIMKSYDSMNNACIEPLITEACQLAGEDDIEKHTDQNNSKKSSWIDEE